jgi:hypothetical protein
MQNYEVAKSQPFEDMHEPQTENRDHDVADDEDLAEVLADVPDYFDEENEDDIMEEYERRAAA